MHAVCLVVAPQGSITLRAVWPDVIAMLRDGLLVEGGPASRGAVCYVNRRTFAASSMPVSKGGSCSLHRVRVGAKEVSAGGWCYLP
jgi:hypothetical protein